MLKPVSVADNDINNEIADETSTDIDNDEQNPTILDGEIPKYGSKIRHVSPDTNQ